MDISNTALVVVDVQNGFVTERSAHVVPAIKGLVQSWKEFGGQTVFTRYINYPGSPYERLIHWSRLQASPEIDIVKELADAARDTDVVDKPIYSLFTDEGAKLVKERGWTNLVFCGIATESCVLKSAADAFEFGYTPWIVTDACGSHAGSVPHEAGLLVIKRFIGKGQLVTSQELVERLSVGATG